MGILDRSEGSRVSIRDVERRQRELALKESLDQYAGRWVALRNGRVVASASDPSELWTNEAVQEGDAIIRVATKSGGYFL
jgi:hypothetical protein